MFIYTAITIIKIRGRRLNCMTSVNLKNLYPSAIKKFCQNIISFYFYVNFLRFFKVRTMLLVQQKIFIELI